MLTFTVAVSLLIKLLISWSWVLESSSSLERPLR